MPHLSPLNWLFTPILMMFILLFLTMILWWQYSPFFPFLKTSSQSSMTKKWNWW